MEQFRLLLLRTAWLIDKHQDYMKVRKDIAAIKVAMPKVLHKVASDALLLHGSLGISTEMPFARQVIDSYFLALGDGPTEVHKITLAKQILRGYEPTSDLFPTGHIPKKRAAALKKFAQFVGPSDDQL
jgi:acyl-CoA dehydrogenase